MYAGFWNISTLCIFCKVIIDILLATRKTRAGAKNTLMSYNKMQKHIWNSNLLFYYLSELGRTDVLPCIRTIQTTQSHRWRGFSAGCKTSITINGELYLMQYATICLLNCKTHLNLDYTNSEGLRRIYHMNVSHAN